MAKKSQREGVTACSVFILLLINGFKRRVKAHVCGSECRGRSRTKYFWRLSVTQHHDQKHCVCVCAHEMEDTHNAALAEEVRVMSGCL